jgi:chain length determinant protein tyrosine kinase EpsG
MDDIKAKLKHTTSIGALLIDAGKINVSDAESIHVLQKQQGVRFGDAAKTLGLIDDEDIKKALAYQFDFPYLTVGEGSFSPELVAAYQPFSVQVDALRAVRGQLLMCWFNTHKTLAIVSGSRNEGRTHMTANLAIVFSQLGERTLLIDADLRQPRQYSLFNRENAPGLSELLAERADFDVIKRVPAFRDLSVLTAGTVPPNPVELISRGLKKCLLNLHSHYDVILLDTPALSEGVEVQLIAAYCEGALLVARQHLTRLNEMQVLKNALLDTGSQCVGVVISEF